MSPSAAETLAKRAAHAPAHDHDAHDHDATDHEGHRQHGHDGHHASTSENKLLFAAALTLATLIVEAVGGWMSGSLALLSDAAHMLIDAFALLLAWSGAHFARRPADDLRSFGYARLEVLAGYSNALLQFVLVVWIAVEAVQRLLHPEPIVSGVMLVVAAIGLVINLVVLTVLGTHHHDDLNLAGARLHVIGDLLGSIGAVGAALLVRYFGWLAADPAVSLLVSALILAGAWRLLRRSAHILLEGTPDDIEAALVAETLRRESGAQDVHHVHVWQLAGGRRMATLHARLAPDGKADVTVAAMKRVLREHFHIFHATVQVEDGDCVEGDCHPQHAVLHGRGHDH